MQIIRMVAALAALWCAAVIVRAQQEAPAGETTFRAGTDIVQVDVSVLDKNRKPVQGLTPADFTVREDGKLRPIVAFTPVDLPDAMPASASTWLRDVTPEASVATNDLAREGRLVLIVFDWSIRGLDQPMARHIARAAVDALGPGDLAAVVFTSAFGNAGVPQNFSNDRAQLLAAIDRPFAAALVDLDKHIISPEGRDSGDCYCRLCVPETITRLADTVRDVPGRRKVMLFVGTFFQGYEGGLPPIAPTTNGLTRAVTMEGGAMPCTEHLLRARTRMVTATNLANLTIDVLDPTPPLMSSIAEKRARQRLDGLQLLSDYTGGRLVANTNDPDVQVPAILAESQSYYLLGFAPANPAATGMHRIEVKVNKPSLTVRSRAGYEAGASRAAISTATPAEAALGGVMPRRDVPLRLALAPFGLAGRATSALSIVLGIGAEAFAGFGDTPGASRSPQTEEVKMLMAALDPKAKPIVTREQIVSVTTTGGSDRRGPYELLSRLELKPGRYEIRVSTDAGASQQGSVYAFVDIPDFTKQRLSLSGVVLSVVPPLRAAPIDGFRDLLPIVPTAQREFSGADKVTVFVRAYQGGADGLAAVQLSARIINAAGARPFDEHVTLSPDRFASNRAADYLLAVPLERVTPGEYLLTIEASLGTHTVRRDVRFAVR